MNHWIISSLKTSCFCTSRLRQPHVQKGAFSVKHVPDIRQLGTVRKGKVLGQHGTHKTVPFACLVVPTRLSASKLITPHLQYEVARCHRSCIRYPSIRFQLHREVCECDPHSSSPDLSAVSKHVPPFVSVRTGTCGLRAF